MGMTIDEAIYHINPYETQALPTTVSIYTDCPLVEIKKVMRMGNMTYKSACIAYIEQNMECVRLV